MTPTEYLERLRELTAGRCYAGALDLARRVERTLVPPLSLEQIDYADGLLEMAATMVRIEQIESAERATRAGPTPTRAA
jgi:hypothetical protein